MEARLKNVMMGAVALAAFAVLGEVVAFKDAAKIKSWDAWRGHKKPEPPKERPCITWEKLNKLDPGLKEIGRLAVRDAKDIQSSKWSIGCETMDRDYADWDAYKAYLGPLGAKHGRLFSGWAKTEQQKGLYDFAWLDLQVREMAAMGVKPWICLSYGNPVYNSDFRLGMRVKQVTENPEGFEAWLRYCAACVARYKDVVDEWEIWNEPFRQGPEYAELFYRTAKAIRAVQPTAKCFCTAVTFPQDYTDVLEKLKRENALDLGSYFIYHPYDANPDESYVQRAEPLRKLVKSYSGAFDILQGEVGCPSQLEFAHALSRIEWSEHAQAKWDLRRTIGDAARAIPSSVFTIIDLQYTFMLQSFGLIRSNAQKEFVYRRPSYYAMQNVFGYLDDEAHPTGLSTAAGFKMEKRFDPRDTSARTLTAARFSRLGRTVRFYWFSDSRPSSTLGFDRITLTVPERMTRPLWVEMITGRVFEIPVEKIKQAPDATILHDLPMWDSPILITDRLSVPLRYDWHAMKPYDIVDTFYRPGQPERKTKGLPPEGSEPWMAMETKDFLPCFDRYGQFRHRDWPGKTKDDSDLKRAAEEEAKDLAAHPGPTGWDRFGGWEAGPQLKATGRFRTEKVDGKWWLVDPEGRLFWSFGPVRVTPSSAMTPLNGDPCTPRRGVPITPRDAFFTELPPAPDTPDATPFSKFWTTHDALLWPFFLARGETRVYDFSSANLYRKYGPDYFAKFADLAHRRLRSWGANTIANSSDVNICLMDRTPYAERVECQSRPLAGSQGSWWKFRDPWDESFKKGVIDALDAHGREAHDPWCIGFFVDNEIYWGCHPGELAEWTLRSPADQPAKRAFVAFLRERHGGEIARLNAAWKASYADWDDLLHSVMLLGDEAKEDLVAFSSVIVEEYFRRTREAVKAFDPQLLYLGCRFAGKARPWVISACAKYCDVVSYNIYRETIDDWRLPDNLDAPVMIGEFHFGATDRGPFGTGIRPVTNQAARAEKLKGYVRSALVNPQIIGVHWHQFSDQATSGRFDGEYFQVGWTDICDTPYPETIAALREIGGELYSTRASASRETSAESGLQGRIDAAAQNGGGVVELAAGLHESGALLLKSGVTLRLAEGAILRARPDKAAYAPSEGHAFILAEHSDNVAIEGPGVIDGGGEDFPAGSLEVLQQPRLVWFRDCRNVRVENVTLRNGRRWTLYLDRCDGVGVRKVTIRSTRQRCCDGIDLECRNALVEDCDIESHDDAICFKNRSSDYTVRNVEVRNCRLATNCSFIKVGTETLGTIRDIHVHHCSLHATTFSFWKMDTWPEAAEFGLMRGPLGMVGVNLQMNDGGILENVRVHDIDMVSGVGVPFAVRLTERGKRVLPGRSALSNVVVENVRGRTLLKVASSVIGTRNIRPQDVLFRNVDLEIEGGGALPVVVPEIEPGDAAKGLWLSIFDAYGFYLRHADGVRFDNVILRPRRTTDRPLFTTTDCTAIDVRGLVARGREIAETLETVGTDPAKPL